MTTPTTALLCPEPAGPAASLEAFCCSGSSPTVHLLGAGAVGQALLHRLAAAPVRVIGVSDSTATAHDAGGLPCAELAELKRGGHSLATRTGAEQLPLPLALDLIGADIVVDATPSDAAHAAASLHRSRAVLRRGQRLVLAAKNALASAPGELLAAENRGRLGIHAVLGGTGLSLQRELAELRRRCDRVALVGNASTTALIEAIERGQTIDRAIKTARDRGLLEADPTLDLDGTDAAVKLAIVAGALWGIRVDPARTRRPHLLDIDAELLAQRAQRGRTTRLVARAHRDGRAALAYEELPRHAPLAAPSDRVAYAYQLEGTAQRVHIGVGLGPDGTAAALLEDVRALCTTGGQP